MWLRVLLILSLLAGPASAGRMSLLGAGAVSGGAPPTTPTKVQNAAIHANGGTSSTTCTATFSTPTTTGNTIVFAFGYGGAGGDNITVSDNASNSYTAGPFVTAASFIWGGWYKVNITGGATTITATIDASRPFQTCMATEFAGTDVNDGNNINGNQAGNATTNGITSNTVTTTASGDLIWGASVNLSGSSTLTKGTAFTLDQASGQDFNTEYLVQGSAGSIAATWTGTAADNFSSLVMTFKHK